MKFGFCHIPAEDYRRHVRLIQVAEELGFDYAWLPDQTFYRDPVPLIAAAALATSRIQIGLGVVIPYTRHPAVVARTAATLDEIAEGRFSLGIGAGNRKELLQPLGLDSGDAARRCREMAEVVRALLAGARVDYRGAHFQAVGVKLESAPPSGLELYIAGRGPLVLEAAGAVADGAIVGGFCSAPGVTYALDQVRRGASAAGRDASAIDIVSWVTCWPTDDRAGAVERLKPNVAHIIGGAPAAALEAAGLPRDLVDRVKAVYSEQGIPAAARLVTEASVDAFTIVGDDDECARRIAALESWGVTQFSMLMPPGDVRMHEERLRRFAGAVFPRVTALAAARARSRSA